MAKIDSNPYLQQIERVLPRLLALYDQNPISQTVGLGDRYFWAWKLIDFGNASFQGAAHGLARLVTNNLLAPEMDDKKILKRILRMADAVSFVRDSNGSVGEAFPHESSFCVTALVAYDLLSAVEVLGDLLSDRERTHFLNAAAPLIAFLNRSEERHAIISNHLATAVAALYKYHALTADDNSSDRGKYFLDRILTHQSDEGWYREYNGADPGYQSLCTYYLADLHRLRPDLGLHDSLVRSIRFLWHFAHPDGSFGGTYGSRNTRFYYPAGPELLREEIPEAGALADFMRRSILTHSTVTLETMDEPNLVPMFNSYCLAAELYHETSNNFPGLPCHDKNLMLVRFPEAGLAVHGNTSSYTVISTSKGGACYHFPRQRDRAAILNSGVVYRDKRGRLFSTQAFQEQNVVKVDGEIIEVQAPLVRANQSLPGPAQFIVLRVLNMTLMRNLMLGNLIKRLLVWLLINRKQSGGVTNCRKICLGENFSILDEVSNLPVGWARVEVTSPFTAIHMASQGYWQQQDDSR